MSAGKPSSTIIKPMNLTQIQQLLSATPTRYALFYQPSNAEPCFLHNRLLFKSASLIKVPILLSWLALEKEGAVSRLELCDLDSEKQVAGAGFSTLMTTRKLYYADVLLMMIATSDNLCTNLVIDRIGLERLNRVFVDGLGLTQTTCQRKLMDYEARSRGMDNWIHAGECVHLYDLIDALSAADRAWVESLLQSNVDAALLMRNIPRDTVDFFHKTGSMEGVLHDWGYTRDCRLFLLTNEVAEEPPIFDVFGALGEYMLPPINPVNLP